MNPRGKYKEKLARKCRQCYWTTKLQHNSPICRDSSIRDTIRSFKLDSDMITFLKNLKKSTIAAIAF